MIDKNAPILYTVDDIQKIFKIGRTKAYQLLRADGFPSITLNRKIYVSKDKLEEWLSRNSGKAFCY